MYNLKFLPSALSDMSEIISYISNELDNKPAAVRLADKFIESAERLREFPYANAVYVPIKPLKYEYRKAVVENYLMFYYVSEKEKTVTVSRVIYGRRNYSELVK